MLFRSWIAYGRSITGITAYDNSILNVPELLYSRCNNGSSERIVMLENIKVMMIGWFYYGILFMAGSVVVTSLLNRVFTKLYIPPLIVNAVSVLLLITGFRLGFPNMGYAMYFNYMPVVFASAMYNFIIFIIRKLKKRLEVK